MEQYGKIILMEENMIKLFLMIVFSPFLLIWWLFKLMILPISMLIRIIFWENKR